MDVQIGRHLDEQEVLEINFIIKSRAYNYIAAANEEWLYPEKYISKSNWNIYGDGLLFMPDPRPVSAGGELIIGNRDGTATGFDPYGRRPWDSDYNKEEKIHNEFNTLYRFKGEFARKFGPTRRGRSFEFGRLDDEIDSESIHQMHLRYGLKKRQ